MKTCTFITTSTKSSSSISSRKILDIIIDIFALYNPLQFKSYVNYKNIQIKNNTYLIKLIRKIGTLVQLTSSSFCIYKGSVDSIFCVLSSSSVSVSTKFLTNLLKFSLHLLTTTSVPQITKFGPGELSVSEDNPRFSPSTY